jgi:PPOX class probable F420-dependent enzyme
VNIVVDGGRAYFRTWSASGKAKRLRVSPHMSVAPSTFRGRPTGASIPASARLLSAEEEERVRQLIARKYPLLQGRLVPLVHRLRHYTTVHYEISAVGAAPPPS